MVLSLEAERRELHGDERARDTPRAVGQIASGQLTEHRLNAGSHGTECGAVLLGFADAERAALPSVFSGSLARVVGRPGLLSAGGRSDGAKAPQLADRQPR